MSAKILIIAATGLFLAIVVASRWPAIDAGVDSNLVTKIVSSASDSPPVSLFPSVSTAPSNHTQAAIQSAVSPNETEGDIAYRSMDAQLRDNLSPPSWFYMDRDVYAEIAALDPTANISDVKCGETACRVIVQHESAEARERLSAGGSRVQQLADQLQLAASEGGLHKESPKGDRGAKAMPTLRMPTLASTTLYKYPVGNPTQTIMYVVKAESPDEIRKGLEARAGM